MSVTLGASFAYAPCAVERRVAVEPKDQPLPVLGPQVDMALVMRVVKDLEQTTLIGACVARVGNGLADALVTPFIPANEGTKALVRDGKRIVARGDKLQPALEGS